MTYLILITDSAPRRGVVTRLPEDVVCYEISNGSVEGDLGFVQQGAVACSCEKIGEAGRYNPLIVRPCSLKNST